MRRQSASPAFSRHRLGRNMYVERLRPTVSALSWDASPACLTMYWYGFPHGSLRLPPVMAALYSTGTLPCLF